MCSKTRFPLALLVFLALGTFVDLQAQRQNQRPPPIRAAAPVVVAETPEIRRRVEAFETVWTSIYFYYFDPTFNKLDWGAVRQKYEPRIRKAASDAEAHEILQEMINQLKVSHLAIIPPEIYSAIEDAKVRAKEREDLRERYASGDEEPTSDEELDELTNFDDPLAVYGIGADLRIIDDSFVITRLDPNSAAEFAGLKTGYVIDSINQVSMNELLGRIAILYRDDDRIKRYLPVEIVNEFLNGEKDSRVEIGFRDASDKAGTVSIRRELLRSQTVALGGNLPDSQLQYESRSLSDDIGYVRFNNFSLPVIERFCSTLSDFRTKRGIVIDLRGNLGGVIGVTVGLSGMISPRPIEIGTAIYRHGPEQLVSQPKARSYNGQIVLLVDELSVSAAEMFASALQESKRAMVVGQRSAGESLPSISVRLSTGATLLYPVANFKTAGGKLLEGVGVTPDRDVKLDRSRLLKGEDTQLSLAMSLIAESNHPVASEPKEFKGPVSQGTGIVTAAPPPPPPPMPAKPKTGSSSGIGSGSPPPAKIPIKAKVIKEPKAVALMQQFGDLAGGTAAFIGIENFEMLGEIEVFNAGASHGFDLKMYRSGKEKYAEILHSPSTGFVKDIRDGKTIHIKSDWGVDQVMPFPSPIERSSHIATIQDAMDATRYTKLLYLGEFERDGRKVELIDGEMQNGLTVAIYFDSETKLLAGFEGPTGGLSFDDYRKVGDLVLPFSINTRGQMNIKFREININTKIDPAVFVHKQNCYDSPN